MEWEEKRNPLATWGKIKILFMGAMELGMKSVFYLAIVLVSFGSFLAQAQNPGMHKNSHSSNAGAVHAHKSGSASASAGPKTDASANELAKIERSGIQTFHRQSHPSQDVTKQNQAANLKSPREPRSKPMKVPNRASQPASRPAQTNSRANGQQPGTRGR